MGGFTAALQRFGIGRLAAVLGVAAGVTAVLIALMLRVGQEPDALLYSNLDLREAAEITAALDQQGIKYSTRGDGSTVMVHRDDVGTARLMLASSGMVTSGSVGYEIFDTQSVLGQTEFQQNLNEKRALEGELARTIQVMRGVNSARVHITLPRREMFQQQAGEPTAAVVVGVGGRDLTGDQIRAIRNVIASSVPNMRPDRVTVVDEANRTLAAGAEEEGFTAGLGDGRRTEMEAAMTARIRDLVEGVVGVGAARVQVSAEIDTSRQTTQEQRYDPDGQVVRSTSTSASNAQDNQAQPDGVVGAQQNIPGGEDPAMMAVGSTSGDQSEITNYEISNTTTTTVREPGQLQRVSVAVAVDGVLTPPAGGEGEPTYTPRSEEDMERIEALVRSAMGFSEDRGDQVSVINVRFNRDTPVIGGTDAGAPLMNFTKNDIMRGVELLILLVTGLLLIFFVLRPLLKTARGEGGRGVTALQTMAMGGEPAMAGALPSGGGNAALPAPNSDMDQRIDIARIEGQVKASSVKKVAEFVDKHPEESVSILRTWVQEG
ncbi:flagellar M-ring protein FliF [Brevundimonas sp. BAL450]|uniref:flagellar basal-body MS-ring/collar protein FliF n=1 Tax=Brevundimonas sp. BAL450 TaxID=1708162 RepID=UPI0018C931DB|nr:flagellar M-ring protein FliF [Brevundimonas sp. BAL450]